MIHYCLPIGLLAALPATGAMAYCPEPFAPTCAGGYGEFEDGYALDSCEREMDRYTREIDDFLRCVESEAESEISRLEREIRDIAEEASQTMRQAAREAEDADRAFDRRRRQSE